MLCHFLVLFGLSRRIWPIQLTTQIMIAAGAFGTALSYRKTGIAGFFLGDEAVKSGNKVIFFLQVCDG